jgi:hypothetical protein
MDGVGMSWSGAEMRCKQCNKYLPDRCTCNGLSVEELRQVNTMDHLECYVELQDFHIPEDELNSVEFDAKYCRYNIDEMRAEVIRFRTLNQQKK